jgi:hypothetical protein
MMNSKSPKAIPPGNEMAVLLDGVVVQWHTDEPPLNWESTTSRFPADLSSLRGQIEHLGLINCYQWHLEDACRMNYDSYEILGKLKVRIDRSNQRRVNMIDEIDSTIYQELRQPESKSAPLALVTPGNLVDGLSILVLKRYHTAIRERIEAGESFKVSAILQEKIYNLCEGIDELIQDLYTGRRKLKFYRTVKLYGTG